MGVVTQKTAAMDVSGKDLEYIRNFRLMDDDYMTKFFEENVECTEFMLRIILEDQGLKVHSVHTQHEIRNLQGHSVKLDIYATDSRGRKINCEVQRTDKGGVPERNPVRDPDA